MGAVISGASSLITGKAPGTNSFNAQPYYAESPVSYEKARKGYDQTQDALTQQQNLVNQLSAQGGIQSQSDILNQQQQLANMLLAQSQGQGPNPAQEQFKKNLAAANQQAAGLISSQKGISPALMAEIVSRQQGAANQNLAGDAAILQAQQQLSAQNQLAAQQQAMQNVTGNQVGQQSNALANLLSGRQSQEQNLYNTLTSANQINSGNQNSAAGLNSQTAAANAANQGKFIGGILNAAGSAAASGGSGLGSSFFANGGEVPSHLSFIENAYHGPKMMAEGGEATMQTQPLKEYTPKKDGPVVPGTPKVNKNSYSNDVVDAKLSPKEIVLPLSVTQSENPAKEAAKFVQAIMKQKEGSSEDSKKEFQKALKEAIKNRKK